MSDIIKACLDIENKINDTISPQPDYVLEPNEVNKTIKLIVKSGLQKPYLYKSKAYKRNDSATIEVDTLEFSRLVLEGKNISFEELPCKDQNLTFHFLEEQLEKSIQINSFTLDTLKTLLITHNQQVNPIIEIIFYINANKIESVISYFDNCLWNMGIQKNS